MSHGGVSLFGLVLAVAFGVVAGLGGFVFVYAKGASYLGNNPAACANCHVMADHYSGWLASSHRAVATCNDCHTPPGLLSGYGTKMRNGIHHSVAFTTGRFHEPIQITHANLQVTERACRECHREIVEAVDFSQAGGSRVDCVRCHASVGHLR